MKKLCMTMLALCAAVSAAYGIDYYLKPGATDFSVAASYTTGSAGGADASTPPGSSDEVYVPAGTYAIAGDSASFTTLSGVSRVRPNDGAILEFTIDDTRTFDAPINYNGDEGRCDSQTIKCYGKVVKKGGGTLILASSGNTTATSGTTTFRQDYFTQIELQQGTLKLPQEAVGNMYFGDITMADDTTLVTCSKMSAPSTQISTLVRSINGYGIVTNESGRAGGMIFTPYGENVVRASEFHGKLCHPVRHWLQGRFVQYGHETGITQPLTVQYNYGHLNGDGYDRGVYSFEDVALLGSSTEINFYNNGGGIHYFGGVDAEMAKNVNLYSYAYPGFFDAGWHGGIRCTGTWNVSAETANANQKVQKWLLLTGSNTVPCTIEGAFNEKDGVPYTIVVQKLGSGAWRFKNNRSHAGGFAIEEGALQFDSIAEKGVKSSLGLSTNLTELASTDNPASVDYAFLLGSTKEEAPAAAFEFTGAKSCQSGTRPLALKGKGGSIRASGTDGARLGFGGVSALAAGETTLVLDGTNTQSNVATGITDGNGVVSVVKDGSGDWYLSGTNTFSGDLLVKSGTLTVQGSKYSWFRFTVKSTTVNNRGNHTSWIQTGGLALYDADGIRQNIGLHVNEPTITTYTNPDNAAQYLYRPDSDWEALEPGAFAFGSRDFLFRYNLDSGAANVDEFFSEDKTAFRTQIATNKVDVTDKKGTWRTISTTNPDSWIPFVMRLTNGTPEIVRYDLLNRGTDPSGLPEVASMEASADGIHWNLVETNGVGDVLTDHAYSPDTTGWKWYSNGDAFTSGQARPGAGFPIRGHADIPTPLQNVRSVSVAAGATLKTDAGVEIRSLKVDSAGAGTIDGFTFAENGTIDVTNPPDSSSFLPGTYVNCSGLENIGGWALKVNGAQNAKCKVSVRDGKLYFARPGFVLMYR